MKNSEISPCPFCGGDKLKCLVRSSRRTGGLKRYLAQIECGKCGARGPLVRSKLMDWRDYMKESDEYALRDSAFEVFRRRATVEAKDFKLEG